jgi:predicted nucleic-acid-binding protein
MIGVDTNLLFYALHTGMEEYTKAKTILANWSDSTEIVIAELVLMEVYQL